ncbi:hypothetical protein [Microbacterium allomyrinae]|nr:hypothetical protein [Microbacterium allomyrinae]
MIRSVQVVGLAALAVGLTAAVLFALDVARGFAVLLAVFAGGAAL